MNLLLDTHVWLWWLSNRAELPKAFKDAIADPAHQVFVSAVSVWEVEIKHRSGKLRFEADLVGTSAELGLEYLSFTVAHALGIRELPVIHKDPFDRALIAQAIVEDWPLLTVDSAVQQYPGLRSFRMV